MQTRRMIATAATAVAVLTIGALLAGCPSAVTPVKFSSGQLTISLSSMVVGKSISETLPEATGGKETLVYTLAPEVPGLTFDAATRVLSGTPTTPGTYDMTYTAKDSVTGGTMESVNFTISVDARPLTSEELMLALRGSWRYSAPWREDDALIGQEVETITFTESRWIRQSSRVYDNGQTESPWAGQDSGEWSAADNAISITWYEWIDHGDQEVRAEQPERFDVTYVWQNDERTHLLLQTWDGKEVRQEYRRYTKVEPASPQGSWTFGFENDEGYTETWTILLEGSSFRWEDRNQPGEVYETVGTAEIDEANLYIIVDVAPDPDDEDPVDVTLRFAYAAGFGDDALALSPYWDESVEHEDGSWTLRPNPKRPHGNYWMLMRRD